MQENVTQAGDALSRMNIDNMRKVLKGIRVVDTVGPQVGGGMGGMNVQASRVYERELNADQIRALARRADVKVPIPAGEPVELSRWRFDRALEISEEEMRKASPILSLSPWEQQMLSLPRVAATVVLQVITGIGLLLLHRQGSREMHRHGLNVAMFFRSDPVRKRQFTY